MGVVGEFLTRNKLTISIIVYTTLFSSLGTLQAKKRNSKSYYRLTTLIVQDQCIAIQKHPIRPFLLLLKCSEKGCT